MRRASSPNQMSIKVVELRHYGCRRNFELMMKDLEPCYPGCPTLFETKVRPRPIGVRRSMTAKAVCCQWLADVRC